ncbi:MAG: DUF5615 family PIN-like protein [Bradymonadaceae bacterium]
MSAAPGSTDHEVLSRAVDDDRLVLTFDRDYGELIFGRGLPSPPGAVYFRFTPETPSEPGELTLELIGESEISLRGLFTVVRRRSVRQRPIESG